MVTCPASIHVASASGTAYKGLPAPAESTPARSDGLLFLPYPYRTWLDTGPDTAPGPVSDRGHSISRADGDIQSLTRITSRAAQYTRWFLLLFNDQNWFGFLDQFVEPLHAARYQRWSHPHHLIDRSLQAGIPSS